jgi:hypothetical protein
MRMGSDSRTRTAVNAMPRYMNVFMGPMAAFAIIVRMRGAMIRADRPNPITVSPTARPFLSGNHFADTAIGHP